MASNTGGGGGNINSSGAPPGKQVPRDIIVMNGLLRDMGINKFEPRILNQMLEFVYRYVTSIGEEARVYSTYAKKKSIDIDDVKLAVKVLSSKSYSTVPPREMLLELAKAKNSLPLPLLKATSGLRLPPDRYCLTQPNYQLQFYKKSIASSNMMVGNVRYGHGIGNTNTNNPNQPIGIGVGVGGNIFKTPSGLPLRTVVLTGNTVTTVPSASIIHPINEPETKKLKLN